MKPYSQSCDRNREPILAILRAVFADRRRVLELGSGTGQHAVHFAAALTGVTWQPSDLPTARTGIQAWIEDARVPNVLGPVDLDLGASVWPVGDYDAFFCANVVHIVGWDVVESMFRGIARHREKDCIVVFYGPYRYGGRPTSRSNAEFDDWLRGRDPDSGVRDFEAVDALARQIGLGLDSDHPMPANNRLLVWRQT